MKLLHALSVIVITAPAMLAGGLKSSQSPDGCWDVPAQEAEKLRQVPKRDSLLQALNLFKRALSCDPASLPLPRKAEILHGIGRVQLRLEDNEQALISLSSALELFQQIQKPSNDLLQEQASAILNKGLALRRLQNIDDALIAYSEARAMFHRLGDNSGESRTLGEIGLITAVMGENRDALGYYRQALELSQADPKQRAAILDFTGRAYAQMNDVELANSYFNEALSLARRTKYYRFAAYTLNDLGTLFVKRKEPRIAEAYHKEALALLQEHEPDDTEGIAETESYLADAQRASGNFAAAIRNYQRGLLLQQQTGDVIGEAKTRVSLGLVAATARDWDLAIGSLTKASELYHRVHERAGESNARFQLARLHISQGEKDAARSQIETAIHLAEEIRLSTPGGRLRTAYFASLEEMYRLKIELLLKQEPVSQADQWLAFDTVQLAKSRALLDVLRARMNAEDLSCPQNLAAARNEVLKKLKGASQRMELAFADQVGEAMIQQLFLGVRRLETALDEIEAQCQDKQPRRNLLFGNTVSLSEIQEKLLDEQTALLQFYLANPVSYAWIITKSNLSLIQLPSKAWLERKVQRVLKFGEPGVWTDSQETAFQFLRKNLLAIFTVPGIRRWAVVPDGDLHYFPFALFSKAGPLPTEIIKIPSASALWTIRKTADTIPARSTRLAVFADPVFDAGDSRVKVAGNHRPNPVDRAAAAVRRRNGGRGSYARLLYSRREAEMISSLMPADQAVWFRDFGARLDAAIGDALSGFRNIHFATHSVVDNRHADLSGIVFSLVAKDGRPIPGYLFLKDIYRMQLHSDLVVLSSCSSAAGVQDAGEGPMSLSRAFLYAGSKAVLASLWEVDDEATAQWMRSFYRRLLKDHLTPSEALSRTQAEFRKHPNPRFRNPLYWAGFELYGDWLVW